MTIIDVSIDKIREYENNPRNNEKAVDVVAKSIAEFGFKIPMVIDKNFVIVCGHTRYKAAVQLGIAEVPCIMADDLTEEQVSAFRLVDNKTSEIAGWDYNLLDKELKELMEQGIDMSEFGFETFGEVDMSDFFNQPANDNKKQKEKKTMQCAHCGEWFEV